MGSPEGIFSAHSSATGWEEAPCRLKGDANIGYILEDEAMMNGQSPEEFITQSTLN